MKKIKRLFAKKLILSFILSLSLVTSIVTVNASDIGSDSDLNFQLRNAREYMSKLIIDYNKIKEMMETENMSRDDAIYYYKIDKLFRYLDKNNIFLNFDNVKALSDEEAVKDKLKTRNKILNLNLAAIKQSINSLSNSSKDREKLEKLMKINRYKHIQKFIFKSSKGAELQYSISKIIEKIPDRHNYLSRSDFYNSTSCNTQVLGYKERVYSSGSNPDGGRLIGDTEWKGIYGVAYAKIWLNDKIDVDVSNDTAEVVYVNGSGASYGIFMFQNSTGGTVNTQFGSGSLPAVTSNQVTFAVSASVGGTIGVSVVVSAELDFSVTGGANFTFHVYDRQYGNGDWEYVAGRYF